MARAESKHRERLDIFVPHDVVRSCVLASFCHAVSGRLEYAGMSGVFSFLNAATHSVPVSGTQCQLKMLQEERAMLEAEISLMQKRLRSHSTWTAPRDVVYAAHTGHCYHTSPNCGTVKDRSLKELKLCAFCSKKDLKQSHAA